MTSLNMDQTIKPATNELVFFLLFESVALCVPGLRSCRACSKYHRQWSWGLEYFPIFCYQKMWPTQYTIGSPKYSVSWSSAKLLSGSSLSKLYIAQLCQKKNPACASTKINTVPCQDYRDLDVCQLTKQRVFLKKRESVKELLLGLVLNEPTHISKFFAISRDTSCPHFFLHNLHCSRWFTLSCRTCLSWWFW